MLAANHEKPFDDHYNGCQKLLQLILFFYEISKTIVFWTNAVLILSDATARGKFSWLRFTTNKFIETVTRLICSVFRPFRAKPLESFDTENRIIVDLIDKILLQQKLKALKIENELHRPLWILAVALGSLIQDTLADTLDFILGTKSRYWQRDNGHRGEATGSMPFNKSRTKDRSSLRRLNTAILDEETTSQLICQNCGHTVICNSCIVKSTT